MRSLTGQRRLSQKVQPLPWDDSAVGMNMALYNIIWFSYEMAFICRFFGTLLCHSDMEGVRSSGYLSGGRGFQNVERCLVFSVSL